MSSVKITNGAHNWQIFQHDNGFGEIILQGHYSNIENKKGYVYCRVAHETKQHAVLQWQKAVMLENKHFTINLTVPVGGLYRIESCFCDDELNFRQAEHGNTIFHIGVGDLYVIAGQSNSAGYGRTPVNDAPMLGVHLFRTRHEWDIASHPFADPTLAVHPAFAENCNPGHCPYLTFGKRIMEHVNYPIGFIQVSLGGSGISQWHPDEGANLYTNMLENIATATNGNNKIKAMLWYQGCTDAEDEKALPYLENFKYFAECFRSSIGQSSLPIVTCQLNKLLLPASKSHKKHWRILREAQRQAAKVIDHVYIVPTIDLPLSDYIHNSSSANITLGERLADIAIGEIYHLRIYHPAPDIAGARRHSNERIRLKFNNVTLNLEMTDMSSQFLPFYVESDEKEIKVLSCKAIDKDTLELQTSKAIGTITTVSYAPMPHGMPYSIFDTGTGLPIVCFDNIKVTA